MADNKGDKVQCTRAYGHCQDSNGDVAGYKCVDGKCIQCPIGTFGIDSMTCELCPFGTWTIIEGQTKCDTSFSFSEAGLQKVHIPFGVNQIGVSLWGGGGGGDKSSDNDGLVAHAGGGGGYLSCNVSVRSYRDVYIIVGGGGSAGSGTINSGGRSHNFELSTRIR